MRGQLASWQWWLGRCGCQKSEALGLGAILGAVGGGGVGGGRGEDHLSSQGGRSESGPEAAE